MSTSNYPFLGPLISAAICLPLLFVLVRTRLLPKDLPNDRSLHITPVPRTGGLAIICAILLSGALFYYGTGTWLALATALALVSFADDWRNLPVMLRLSAHFLAALVLIYYTLPDLPLPLATVIVIGIVWGTNLYNFMDGADGLAGGMTLFGFCVYAIAGWIAGNTTLAWFCASVSTAAAVFLLFNFHPARIFLGDVGSIPLGFLAAAIGAYGWAFAIWPAWFPLLVFSAFIVDASLTLAWRAARGARVWSAHRDHYYQRLVRMGLGHRNTALAEYALMAASGISALLLLQAPVPMQQLVLLIWAAVYLALALTVNRKWASHLRGKQHDSA